MALPEIKQDEYYADGLEIGLNNNGTWKDGVPLNLALRGMGISMRARSGLYCLMAYDKQKQRRELGENAECVIRDIKWLRSFSVRKFHELPGMNKEVAEEILQKIKTK